MDISPKRIQAVLRGDRRNPQDAVWTPHQEGEMKHPTWAAIVGMNVYRIIQHGEAEFQLALGHEGGWRKVGQTDSLLAAKAQAQYFELRKPLD